jgi:hypothetical protein
VQRSVPDYVAQHPQLRLIDSSEDRPAYSAAGALKLARNLRVGACTTGEVVEPKLFVLAYAARPAAACGTGWLAAPCRSAWQNCVATPYGILCDHSYLQQLYLLQLLVLSQHRAVAAAGGPALPTDAMLGLARIAQRLRAGEEVGAQFRALLEKHPWKRQGTDDDVERMLAEVGTLTAVVLHEAAHVEQAGCALGRVDPRYEELKEVLEEVSCRSLPTAEIRADLRAMDVAAVAAREIQRLHRVEAAARSAYLRALAARLEYEAMVLPNPEYAVAMYAAEPSDPARAWDHYFDAGLKYPTYAGSGHIPPELRPVAALWMLNSRGFMVFDANRFAAGASSRLRPFLTGLLWKRCAQQYHAFGIRDALNLLMFKMDLGASRAASPSLKPPTYFEPVPRGGDAAVLAGPRMTPGVAPAAGCDPVAARHAVDLGIRAAALLAAHVRGHKEDAVQAYAAAVVAARELNVDLPLSPDLPVGRLGSSGSEPSTEGFLFVVETARGVGESIARTHGRQVAGAFMFSLASLSAKVLSADAGVRDGLLQVATRAAKTLELPMELVTTVFRAVENERDAQALAIVRQLERVVAHCAGEPRATAKPSQPPTQSR